MSDAALAQARKVLDRHGLVPVRRNQAELLDKAIDLRLELDRSHRLLRDLAADQGDGSMADLLLVMRHRLELVEERYRTAEAVIKALQHGHAGHAEIAAWKRATHQHTRST